MKLSLVPGGKVFSFIGETDLYVKVDERYAIPRFPSADPSHTELAIKIGGDGVLFHCTHNRDVIIHRGPINLKLDQ